MHASHRISTITRERDSPSTRLESSHAEHGVDVSRTTAARGFSLVPSGGATLTELDKGHATQHPWAMEAVEFPGSTTLAFARYDEVAGTLEIGLRNGALYRYFVVPRQIFEGLLSADSPGRFFVRHIREQYTSQRLREKDS